MRRTWVPLAVVALAVLAFARGGYAEHEGHHAAAFDACAKACSDCQRACDSCANHCSHMVAEGKKEHLKTLQTCQDCATHCAAAAAITARQGPFADLICTACAEACVRYGKECAKFPEDKHMKACAEECKKCAKACREMLSHTGKATTSTERKAESR